MKKNNIVGYKGFRKDMTCRDFQYKEGETYEMESKPSCCNRGFHFCENPVDCLGYYDPNNSVYHKVEALGDLDKERGQKDTKVATNKIKIGARLSFKEMVDLSIDFTYKHCKKGGKGSNKRSNNSVASNTGYSSVASNTGYSSVASNTGDRSVASNTGYRSVASNTGDRSVASNTGYRSVASNTGDRSVAKNTGKDGIASSLGIEGQASGGLGTWLVLAEWWEDEDWNWHVKEVKTVKVDGKEMKENTLYKLENGKIVEIEE